MNLTSAQQQAIAARGNVLVMAGAGTGKTSTLVERCLDCLLDEKNPASLDEILMVTFTDAAAAQMRQRIRARLEAKVAEQPEDLRWPEQLALFDTAHIGTLHSFCLQLVRQHFYELELDPQLAVMPEEESRLLADETLDKLLQEHYAGKTPQATEVQQLIQMQGGGWDKPIRDLVMRLHHYTQTLRDPEKWVEQQLEMFRSPEPVQWRLWLDAAMTDWRGRWLQILESELAGNEKAVECAAILAKSPTLLTARSGAELLQKIIQASQVWPKGKKGVLGKPLAPFFAEAAFLESLARDEAPVDPLAQDWQWVRGQMITLLELTREFSVAYANSKRELASLDFHDLEQHALRLLWDRDTGQPSAAAGEWRRALRYIFVDEYQDINEAQDAILAALSRDGGAANRFLVGDVKQSIYRFRLADPRIFQNYVAAWSGETGQVIPLTENFRSRESILLFVNSLFAVLMRAEIGGVPYHEGAHLRFGDPENRALLGRAQNTSPRVELHLRVKRATGGDTQDDEEDDGKSARTELANLEEAAKEARLTAFRLRELKNSGHLIWDESNHAMRPVQWSDMAVLLRSMRGKAESFAREFARLGVPVTVTRGSFYESLEISDLVSLFQLLDNPLQDLPALAVLRSPLVGMSVDELAAIRLALPKAHFWSALLRFHEKNPEHPAWAKADRFLNNHAHWRRLARQSSLARCLETVLDETHYADWLLAQPRGGQRHANVRRLVALAQEFDQFQRQGLFRFLRFVEAQQEAETEPQVAAVSGDDAVRLMSIHQSKGLEFPVVAVADLAKPFNLSDLRAEIILDPELGLCPRIKPPHSGRRYPSLPYWMAAQRQKRESLGEEMRLLYVAMTRARDTLILTGAVSEKQLEADADSTRPSATRLLAARSYLDWLLLWFAGTGGNQWTTTGENEWLQWNLYEPLDARLRDDPADSAENATTAKPGSDEDENELAALRARLAWEYPHPWAVKQAAKTSVTALRRQWAEQMAEAEPFAQVQGSKFKIQNSWRAVSMRSSRISAAETGTAHHVFLQWMNLEMAGATTSLNASLKAEAHRLQLTGVLDPGEVGALDFEALAAFWNSDLGKKIREQAAFVKRELPFTARFSPAEISVAQENQNPDEHEFVVVQGVADLIVLLPKEIWLVDFKTDRMTAADLPEKIKQYESQLRLYALALARIYNRPVTETWLHFLELRESALVGEASY